MVCAGNNIRTTKHSKPASRRLSWHFECNARLQRLLICPQKPWTQMNCSGSARNRRTLWESSVCWPGVWWSEVSDSLKCTTVTFLRPSGIITLRLLRICLSAVPESTNRSRDSLRIPRAAGCSMKHSRSGEAAIIVSLTFTKESLAKYSNLQREVSSLLPLTILARNGDLMCVNSQRFQNRTCNIGIRQLLDRRNPSLDLNGRSIDEVSCLRSQSW